MLRLLNKQNFDRVYEIMEESFPPDERRDYEAQKALLKNKNYKIYVINDDINNDIKAFIAIYELKNIIFIEHFAVSSAYRNQGLGSVILNELLGVYDKPFCLEAEPPENEISIRRIEFYKRNGFSYNDYAYEQPAFSDDKRAVPLKIMSSGKVLSYEDFTDIKTVLYRDIYNVGE